jgi:hypothetical protein
MSSTDFSREVIKDIVFKFSPETQKIKKKALDTIVKNAIYKLDNRADIDLMTDLLVGKGGISPSPKSLKRSIDRLIKNESIKFDRDKYRLTDKEHEKIDQKYKESLGKKRKIIKELINHTDENVKHYLEPFNDVLSYIFAELGEESVNIIIGNPDKDIIGNVSVKNFCQKISDGKNINEDILYNLVIDFFDKSDPYYDTLK